jgi:hypothetical protein
MIAPVKKQNNEGCGSKRGTTRQHEYFTLEGVSEMRPGVQQQDGGGCVSVAEVKAREGIWRFDF